MEFERLVKGYFSDLDFRIKNFNQARRELDVYVSSEFNVFDFIKPDENRLSDIISDLLSSSGSHGQGDLFLREFLAVANIKREDFDGFAVAREDLTTHINNANRRIDITIDMGHWGVGIENKPWALEQKDQLEDYVEHMDKRYNGDFYVIYISGKLSLPVSINIQRRENLFRRNRLILFPYRTKVVKWLSRCRKECESDRYRWFIKDLIDYIEIMFPSYVHFEGD